MLKLFYGPIFPWAPKPVAPSPMPRAGPQLLKTKIVKKTTNRTVNKERKDYGLEIGAK